ncbi:Spx/MgsR family RNA polymerase-binding regulatory protein [Campylobacter coli]|nr:Spx/MgsR family RNA polymerase-binding regulatory protein [Campylobacter coli]EFL6826005.1 Spx/MgsR family RNA polymerase-binding regulatory protein [Campylobacter coli]EFV1822498.1 Spx/MgsR family RNA polymerase-binding regulatory protein [Campylobacter coli]EGH6345530.1 Spx/MgsR family RNA polymerase-binding regulatory protein [Campylobacter coli]EGS0653387.1 Spx/MgsR family RNA polymerase-binding regulatory protein [Campylobacter coli]
MKVYGIKNCNSVKKALEFLDKKALEFDFIDIKKIDLNILENWLKYKKFSEIINTTGTTSKKLGLNKDKIERLDEFELKNIILENPSCIKRPVIEKDNQIYIGKEYEQIS